MIGQPFDIVKVRLQTTTEYKGALDCASQIFKHEGGSAFYKGTLTPLIGIGACVSVQFGAFNYARRAFEASNAAKQHKTVAEIASQPQPLAYWQYYASGAFAGISNTVLSSPIEHIRIRLQTQPHGAGRLYNGPIDCIRKLSRSPSVAMGLYRGTSVTFLREAQAYGFWFLSFEYMMQSDAKRNNISRKSPLSPSHCQFQLTRVVQVRISQPGRSPRTAALLASFSGFLPIRLMLSSRRCRPMALARSSASRPCGMCSLRRGSRRACLGSGEAWDLPF